MISSHRARLCIAVTAVGLLVLMTACQPAMPESPAQHSPNGVIFTAKQTEAVRTSIGAKAEGVWTPTEVDVARLEVDLLPFLQQAQNPSLRVDPPIWERAPDYKRQYLGLMEAGQRVIYANFFCQVFNDMDWEHKLVFVLDGGDCYFQVKYNPETGAFYDLNVNGES